MNEQTLTASGVTYYALKVNGVVVTTPVQNMLLAEGQRSTLSPADQPLAEVTVVSSTGQELLLG